MERERKRAEREEMRMDVDGDGGTKRDLDVEDDVPSCLCFTTCAVWQADVPCRYKRGGPSICFTAETLL